MGTNGKFIEGPISALVYAENMVLSSGQVMVETKKG